MSDDWLESMWYLDDIEEREAEEEALRESLEAEREREEEEARLEAQKKEEEKRTAEAARRERIRRRKEGIHLDQYTGKIIYGKKQKLDQYTGRPIEKEEKIREQENKPVRVRRTNKLDRETGKYI